VVFTAMTIGVSLLPLQILVPAPATHTGAHRKRAVEGIDVICDTRCVPFNNGPGSGDIAHPAPTELRSGGSEADPDGLPWLYESWQAPARWSRVQVEGRCANVMRAGDLLHQQRYIHGLVFFFGGRPRGRPLQAGKSHFA
jgi:hypothetical protein